MFKMVNNRKGFTLVELIVVIVILAVLAAIAIPQFMGYAKQARISSDIAAASNLLSAAAVYLAEAEKSPSDVADWETALTTAVPGYSAHYAAGDFPIPAKASNNVGMVLVVSTEGVLEVRAGSASGDRITPNGTGVYAQ